MTKITKVIIAIAILIIIVGGIFAWQKGLFSKISFFDTLNWRTYRNENYGFEIKYPDNILKLNEDTGILSHTLKNFHIYSEKDGSDLGLANDIMITFKKNIDKCNKLERTIKDIAIPFKQADFQGFAYESGAEGMGVIYYCFKNDKDENTFLIERWFLSEAYSTELPKQSDYISSEKQKEIFNQMVSTFKFLEIEKPYIRIISPNGGEKLVMGNTYDIKWESRGVEKVDIDLYGPIPNQKPFSKLIATDVLAVPGEYSWTISEDVLPGNNFVVIITQNGEVYPRDESDNYFSIPR